MTLPKEAILEKILPGGYAIYDISHILPKPTNPRYNKRPENTKIVRLFFHHSGHYGQDGYDGAEASVNYVIRERDFGARPYHFWLAYKPDVDNNGNVVIYRLAKNSERCWHTGQKANDEGMGIVWQGNLSPEETGKPSKEQYGMANILTKWLIYELGISLPDGMSFHAEADKWGGSKKPSCPGPFVQEWVIENRNSDKLLDYNSTKEKEEEKKKPDSADGEREEVSKNNKENHEDNVEENSYSNKKENKTWFQKAKEAWLDNLFPGRNK